MTDSEGKEIALDGMTAFDRQDVEFVSAIREGRNRNLVPPVAYHDGAPGRDVKSP